VHTLAARRLITDFEDDKATLPTANPGATVEDIRKAVIVRLGEEYQLASRHTSFVAVDADAYGTPISLGDSRGRSLSLRLRLGTRRLNSQRTADAQGSNSLSESVVDNFLAALTYVSSAVDALINRFQGGISRDRPASDIPGAFPNSHSPSPSLASSHAGRSTASFSTLSSLNKSLSTWTQSRTPSPSPPPSEHTRSPSPPLQSLRHTNEEVQRQHGFDPQSIEPSDTSAPVASQIFDLVQLQAFDGSFPLDESLGKIVGQDVLAKAADFQVDNKTWATALAVAYLKKHLSNQPDLLEGLLDKAMEFVRGNTNFNALVARAGALL